jgi:hypothetical protein
MNHRKKLNQQLEAITWGVILIFVGVLLLVPSIPPGAGTLGIGILLLGLNIARIFSRMPVNRFTLTFGLIAVLLGGGILIGNLRGFQLEGPFIPALLIAAGIYWLLPEGSERTNGIQGQS